MTLKVVTQYYRAPELLAGCQQYGPAIDMWSIGCIVGELLGRKVLFMGSDADSQLDLILELLGTPSAADISHISSPVSRKRLLSVTHPSTMPEVLYQLSPNASHGVVHLLSRMLLFNPVRLCDVIIIIIICFVIV